MIVATSPYAAFSARSNEDILSEPNRSSPAGPINGPSIDGERPSQRSHQPAGRISRRIVVRIGLDNSHSDHPRLGEQLAEQRLQMIELQIRAVGRDIGERQVQRVEHVDIEVHDERVLRQRAQRPAGRTDRIGDDIRRREPRGGVDQAVDVFLVVGITDERDRTGRQQRTAGTHTGKLVQAPGQVQHVRDPHPVQDRLAGVIPRNHEVLSAIDVEQPDIGVVVERCCDESDSEGAVATENQRPSSPGDRLTDLHAAPVDDVDRCPPVIGLRVLTEGGPLLCWQVSVINHLDPGSLEPRHNSSGAQGSRSFLQARPVCRRAGWDPDQGPGIGNLLFRHLLTVARPADTAAGQQ